MELEKAIDQISEIHKHLAKSEVFKGYRPLTVFLIGAASIIFAVIQTIFRVKINNLMFIILWASFAAIIFILIIGNIIINYFKSKNKFEKLQLKKILIQFMPFVLSGLIVTIIFINLQNNYIKLLPGIWALLFGLALFSMLPYLPQLIGLIGLFYIVSGSVLIYITKYNLSLSPWGMGLTFGIGHFLSSLILYLHLMEGN